MSVGSMQCSITPQTASQTSVKAVPTTTNSRSAGMAVCWQCSKAAVCVLKQGGRQVQCSNNTTILGTAGGVTVSSGVHTVVITDSGA